MNTERKFQCTEGHRFTEATDEDRTECDFCGAMADADDAEGPDRWEA